MQNSGLVVSQYHSSHIWHNQVFIHKWPLCYSNVWVGITSGTFQIKFKFHTLINSNVSGKKQALSKMSFYQQNTISLYSWFLLVLSCNIFLMTFHGSIFLNIKLRPTTTSSPRRRGRGLHNPDSSHDQIRCFWLAEVRNFTNIMIESRLNTWLQYIAQRQLQDETRRV